MKLRKGRGRDLGLDFEEYLMAPGAAPTTAFSAFIDQPPRGLRRTLYFKDDDARLSFLTAAI